MPQKKIPSIWSIEAHTKAKHQILEEYLKAWFPIIGRWASRIVYLDGFAGPGEYKDGEDGSPIIAIKTAIEHTMLKPTTEITFGFIEKDKERAENLSQVLKERFDEIPKNMNVQVENSEFKDSLSETLDGLEKKRSKISSDFCIFRSFWIF